MGVDVQKDLQPAALSTVSVNVWVSAADRLQFTQSAFYTCKCDLTPPPSPSPTPPHPSYTHTHTHIYSKKKVTYQAVFFRDAPQLVWSFSPAQPCAR